MRKSSIALIYPVRYDTQQTATGSGAPQAVDLSKLLKDYPRSPDPARGINSRGIAARARLRI